MKKNIILFLFLSLSAGLFAAEAAVPQGDILDAELLQKLNQIKQHAVGRFLCWENVEGPTRDAISSTSTYVYTDDIDGTEIVMAYKYSCQRIDRLQLTYSDGRLPKTYVKGTEEYRVLCVHYLTPQNSEAKLLAALINEEIVDKENEESITTALHGVSSVQDRSFNRYKITIISKKPLAKAKRKIFSIDSPVEKIMKKADDDSDHSDQDDAGGDDVAIAAPAEGGGGAAK